MAQKRSLLLIASIALGFASVSAAAPDARWAVVDVRLFDGERVVPRATVQVEGARIVAAGEAIELPEGVERIDGRGSTLLPGLIDAHTHAFGDALERALTFGVTTEIDMFTDPAFARQMRQEQADGGASERADLVSAGYLATAPGGHGTQYGLPVPTLDGPRGAESWVAERLSEGSDFIKIVSEDAGGRLATLDRPTIAALIAAAHGNHRLAVVHATAHRRAREAIEDGADGLVHIFRDEVPGSGFAELVKRRGAFVVPTLAVMSGAGELALAEDPRLRPFLKATETSNLARSLGRGRGEGANVAREMVRRLHERGVPILAGSDAPNPGTAHGAAIHLELELLVAAGLTPVDALRAATSAPADAFRLDDRGRIAPGRRADLLLVAGDPTVDIKATRDIRGIWKAGQPFTRVPASGDEPAAGEAAAIPESGLIADFDDGRIAATFGFGWAAASDQRMGGASTAEIALVDGGAEESAGALAISGTIRSGFAFPWAGAIFFAGSSPMDPVDLSAFSGLELWARGTPGRYRILLFAEGLGPIPPEVTFEAGGEWSRHRVSFGDFEGGFDGEGAQGFFIGGGPEPGELALEVDGVRLLREEPGP